jgi:hypothetical protein
LAKKLSIDGDEMIKTAAQQLGVTTPYRELIATRMGAIGANATSGGTP